MNSNNKSINDGNNLNKIINNSASNENSPNSNGISRLPEIKLNYSHLNKYFDDKNE